MGKSEKIGRTRENRVTPNSHWPQRNRTTLHQTLDPGFCWCVMTLLSTSHQSRDTAHRNDTPPFGLLLCHLISDRLNDIESTVEVDILYAFP